MDREAPNYEERLLELIDAVLSGQSEFSTFERDYYHLYLDELPSGLIDDEHRELFGNAQMKLDWTAEAPDEDDRQYGWMDRVQYLSWLRRARTAYRTKFGR
ncbi:MAG: hypothetical protein ACYDEB_02195 [Dehalococcoidia bacterium]